LEASDGVAVLALVAVDEDRSGFPMRLAGAGALIAQFCAEGAFVESAQLDDHAWVSEGDNVECGYPAGGMF
jgi:hypothetical protein